jgi:hypothetical protein
MTARAPSPRKRAPPATVAPTGEAAQPDDLVPESVVAPASSPACTVPWLLPVPEPDAVLLLRGPEVPLLP